MLLSRVMSAFSKEGITIQKNGNRFYAIFGAKRLKFHENGVGSGQVNHFTYESPHTNSSYDCFCDSYYKSIKAAIWYLKESN